MIERLQIWGSKRTLGQTFLLMKNLLKDFSSIEGQADSTMAGALAHATEEESLPNSRDKKRICTMCLMGSLSVVMLTVRL